ncbi:uncharacterized protein LOC113311323 [Papaver somniferum]|uniref:uncharacterized protein LOC113311323 n=1 Tax=Papaver somniferum TaxID=3469 RepID=UPI000E6F6183|nr:uncharacterized protein LOC113311323 [Papaver somniferum]
MKANSDTVEDSTVVEKILRSLPEKFESKVTAKEECSTVATMTLNELLGSLQAYEQRLLEKTFSAKQVEEALQSQVSWRSNQGKPNAGRFQGRYNNGGRFNTGEEEEEEEQKDENMLLAYHTAEEQSQLKWYLDIGFSNHMYGRKDLFDRLDESVRSTVKFGNSLTIPVMAKGRIGIILKNGSKAYFMDVLYVPGLHRNLLSMGQLSERGYSMNIYNAKKEMMSGLPFIQIPESRCENCIFGKQQRDPFPVNKARRTEQQLEIIHSELCGPIEVI